MPRLVSLEYSPWSEKARWALDHHRVAYSRIEHVPMLGEPVLRALARKPFGRVSVPLLIDDGAVIQDSFQIARYAERRGGGSALFPAGQDDAIATWNRRSEVLTSAGRARLLGRIAHDQAALAESLPAMIPGFLRSALAPMAEAGVSFLAWKYRASTDAAEGERQLAAMAGVLSQLRDALAQNKGHVLREGFTYADITMAVGLQVVRPVDERWVHLGPASRNAWTEPSLAGEFSDLLEWRDALYAERRR